MKEIVDNIIRHDQQIPKPCILCSEATRNRGAFFPFRSAEWGAPSGKLRIIIYPLCERHDHTDSFTLLVVERRLREGLDAVPGEKDGAGL